MGGDFHGESENSFDFVKEHENTEFINIHIHLTLHTLYVKGIPHYLIKTTH